MNSNAVASRVLVTIGCGLLLTALLSLQTIPDLLIARERGAGRPVDRSEVELIWLERASWMGPSGVGLLVLGVAGVARFRSK